MNLQERLTASEQAIQLDSLISAVRAQGKISTSPAPAGQTSGVAP